MAIYCPDVFFRVIKGAHHGLVKQICLKKVLIINLERNHFFTMNMLSCGVLLWELETGSWWTLPSFSLMAFPVAKLLGTNHHPWGEVGLFPCIPSPCKYPPVFVLQLCVADSVPAPAACQRHVAAGAHGSQQRRHDISLSLCHFQLPAGKWDGVSSVADPGEHTAAPRPPKTC